jgi:hypothetical protein
LGVLVIAVGCGSANDPPSRPDSSLAAAVEATGSTLRFEPNAGQCSDPTVRYVARAHNSTAFITDDSLVIVAWAPATGDEPLEGDVIRIAFDGADPSGFEPDGALAERSHYFRGNDPSTWVQDVPASARVVARDMYPGVDVVFKGSATQEIQFDFVVAPGASAAPISMSVTSLEAPSLDARGDLRIPTRSGSSESTTARVPS